MSLYKPLYRWLGDPVVVIGPADISTAGIAASDNAAGVPIAGAAGVEFLLVVGLADTGLAMQVQIQYSSTGSASDAVTSNAGMTCTDAIFAQLTTDHGNSVHILDFSVEAKGLSDAAGTLHASIAAAENGSSIFGLIGRPYGGHIHLPATNAITVVEARA
jgi:hypothetical protein